MDASLFTIALTDTSCADALKAVPVIVLSYFSNPVWAIHCSAAVWRPSLTHDSINPTFHILSAALSVIYLSFLYLCLLLSHSTHLNYFNFGFSFNCLNLNFSHPLPALECNMHSTMPVFFNCSPPLPLLFKASFPLITLLCSPPIVSLFIMTLLVAVAFIALPSLDAPCLRSFLAVLPALILAKANLSYCWHSRYLW